jgi:hypothetical protein
MESSGCLARRIEGVAFLIGLLAVCWGCTTAQQTASTRAPAYAVGVELPAGEGREILVTECLNCHELDALELFQDFYDRGNWRSLVVSMRANGAEVDDLEVEVLADYLARHFGVARP